MKIAQNDEAFRRLETSQLALAQRGERQALGWLYDAHSRRLYQNVLYPLLGNRTAAEDALSETFRSAFRNLANVRPGSEGIYPWLAKIARNKALDMHRARVTTGRALTNLQSLITPLMGEAASPEQLLDGAVSHQDLASAVQNTLTQLNERYRRAIELRFFQDQPREICAELLGVKLGTFDVLLLRALRAFRKVWPTEGALDDET